MMLVNIDEQNTVEKQDAVSHAFLNNLLGT